ncbi:hypothetical protein HYH03_012623 [Edaphochlamys debaryana]|uniref:Uncharacterized protein n=1 Tax=Edaphochlamys debaryana TaxID=47281 RepID=A0A835Y093_9CHLO|nr:hypothetical protein HYH03_012623 [Edaphochlamys debaryana]|eukprot:KAG2488824.1 hypothetical protein HYH03_012623 [Edaphochlamys debaryana]
MPDAFYVRTRLSAPGAPATAPLPSAALSLQHACAPASNWLDSHDSRPAPLSREACAAQGTFELDAPTLARLAAAAGVPGASPALFAAPSVPLPPVPAPPTQPPPLAPVPVTATAATPPTSASQPPPPPPPVDQSPPSTLTAVTVREVSFTAATCHQVSRTQCLPTLPSLAAALGDAAAALPPGNSTAQMEADSDVRALLEALESILRCLASGGATSSSSSTEGTATSSTPEACTAAALAAHPSAARAFNATFMPACASLSSVACVLRPGCALEAHGDHFDCIRSRTFASAYIAAGVSGPEGDVLAGTAQRLADSCRAGVATCGQSQVPLMARPAALDALARLLAASEEDHDHEEEGHEEEEDHDHEEDDHDHDDHAEGEAKDSQPLRIAGVFVILVAGLSGASIPIVFRNILRGNPLAAAGLRALCAGVLLSLALVHVSTHAVMEMEGLETGSDPHEGHDHRRMRSMRRALLQSMDELEDYGGEADSHEEEEGGNGGPHDHGFPWGMTCVLFGFLVMAGMEHLTHALYDMAVARAARRAAEKAAAKAKAAGGDGADGAYLAQADSGGCDPQHDSEHPVKLVPALSQNALDVASKQGTMQQAKTGRGSSGSDEDGVVLAIGPTDSLAPNQLHNRHNHQQGPAPVVYASGCATHASSLGAAAEGGVEGFRLMGLAVLFELGCSFHSFLIGLMLGTAVVWSEARNLLIVLAFHQFLEGVSLSDVLTRAKLKPWQLLVGVLLYSVTCPAGVGVGIGIADTYDSGSTTARAVQGTINGVAAGLLLYLAAALVLQEFGSEALARWRPLQRLFLYGLMWLGAAVFTVLALWA